MHAGKASAAAPRYGPHWGEVGFQGHDPATDLRGCGMLGLLQVRGMLGLLGVWHAGPAAGAWGFEQGARMASWAAEGCRLGGGPAAGARGGGGIGAGLASWAAGLEVGLLQVRRGEGRWARQRSAWTEWIGGTQCPCWPGSPAPPHALSYIMRTS